MTRNIVTSFFAAMILAVSSCAACAQNGQPCGASCYPSYQQFCQKNFSNSCVGQNIFSDKMVRPFNHCMSSCSDICVFPSGFGGCFDRLLGRNVPCAGPDFGYVYKPGYGANGQGLAPGWRSGFDASNQQGYSPSYTYRSPRDFLNPNPPSIGY